MAYSLWNLTSCPISLAQPGLCVFSSCIIFVWKRRIYSARFQQDRNRTVLQSYWTARFWFCNTYLNLLVKLWLKSKLCKSGLIFLLFRQSCMQCLKLSHFISFVDQTSLALRLGFDLHCPALCVIFIESRSLFVCLPVLLSFFSIYIEF